MRLFLVEIDDEVLTQKIPKAGLAKSFYYRIIVNDLVVGLILQGHFKEALMFCGLDISCQLAYLCLDYKLMIN